MKINKSYISNNNTYTNNAPRYIIVHNTDNFKAGANALAHAKAQCAGNFNGMSAHYYTDDGDTVYQATPYNRGCWHVGKNYGGRLFGTVHNRNTIGVEMCVQSGYNFTKAFNNTVALVKQLMKELGIPADRVLQHFDVCAKNCPSQIRAKGKWAEFKSLLGQNTSGGSTSSEGTSTGSASTESYKAGLYQVTVASLNIRSGAGVNHGVVNVIKDKGTYTITEIQNGSWGKLKSGAGWINVDKAYCKRVGDAKTTTSTTAIPTTSGVFQVRVSINDLNIRTGAGTNHKTTGAKTGKGIFTIVETKSGTGSKAGWGRLKSGAGWISLDYATRI